MTVMHLQTEQRETIDIGDGLIMRWSTTADTANVGSLVAETFRWLPFGDPHPEDKVPGPNEFVRACARRTLSGKSPVMSEYDCALVEDTKRETGKNPVVACVSLHRCKAYYGSVDVYFGKPELVATDPDYRNKGLIRRLFLEMIHPESEARGDVLQFISGILHFYRQFGYEYGLKNNPAGRIESSNVVSALAKDQSEPYILRPAKLEDLPFLNRLSTPKNMHTYATVGTRYSPEYWHYTVHGVVEDKQSRFDGSDRDTRIIVAAESGKALGFTVMSHSFMTLEAMALDEDLVSYVDILNSTMRQLFVQSEESQKNTAKAREAALKKNNPSAELAKVVPSVTVDANTATSDATTNTETANEARATPFSFRIRLHERHPLSLLLGNKIRYPPKHIPGFMMYTRIQNYPVFIKAVAVELEKRLADSALAGVSGLLRLDFFRQVEGSSGKGLEVVLENGKIVDAKDYVRPSQEKLLEEKLAWKAAGKIPTVYFGTFAPLSFTSLVTGKDSLEELQWSYGENQVLDDATRLLLNTLFPKGGHHFDMNYF